MAKPESKKPSFWKSFKSEFNQIVWPTRKELYSKTLVVLFISFIITILIYGYDSIYNFVLGKFFL